MPADDRTLARIAKNQSTFRAANERVEQAAETIGIGVGVPFICECPEPACTQIVPLSLDEYAEIRGDPRRFFNAPGHEATSVQNGAGVVVERRDRYVIVEKVGLAGDVAAAAYEDRLERDRDG